MYSLSDCSHLKKIIGRILGVLKKIRVAMITTNLERHGISTVVTNYGQNLDKKNFEVVIITGSEVNEEYRRQCKNAGVEIIEITSKKKNVIKYSCQLFYSLHSMKFDIVHVHGNSATMTLELFIAKINHIKIRIAHCHNSTCNHIKLHRFLLPLFRRLVTGRIACSQIAGNWIFPAGGFIVLPNAFSIEKYKFDPQKRRKIRSDLKIDDSTVIIGHVGRLNQQKNQKFIIEIFDKIMNKRNDFKLLLVGDGPNRESIMRQIENSSYKNQIIMYGESDDPSSLYDAMDIFVCPSLYEGFGNVVIEAQISGLPIVASDAFPEDTHLTSYIKYKSLSDDSDKWADSVIAMLSQNRDSRNDLYQQNKELFSKYEIMESVHILEKFYKQQLDIKFNNT